MSSRLILVIDDGPCVSALDAQFKLLDCETRVVASLGEAICSLQERPFHLILADLWMENGAGERLLDWLHQEQREEPVIFMAEDADYDLLIEYINKGAVDLISKPPEPAQLRRSLSLALGGTLLTA